MFNFSDKLPKRVKREEILGHSQLGKGYKDKEQNQLGLKTLISSKVHNG